MTPFTADMARTMTPEQIRAFWIARQTEAKASGKPSYDRLIDAATGRVLIDLRVSP